jgi:hypothetical protein
MRTKALLCAAGLLAAGAATSLAQVYSLNVVGYLQPATGTNQVAIGLTNGFNLVANQLDADLTGTNNTLQSVFGTNLPVATTVFAFDRVAGYKSSQYAGGANWTGNANTNTINANLAPGAGVWVLLGTGKGTPTPLPVTLVGNVLEGSHSVLLSQGFQIVSIVPPLSTTIQTGMGLTPKTTDTVFMWDAVKKSYDTRQFATGTSWTGPGGVSPNNQPTPAVGSAFWYKSTFAGNTNWTQNYTVPRP